MPRIHQYVDGRGLYIKARHEGRITTYQVSVQGEQFLQEHGIGPGSEIDTVDLIFMLERGLIYTGGSGPGILDEEIPVKSPPSQFNQTSATPKTSSKEDINWGCAFIIAIFVMVIIIGLSK